MFWLYELPTGLQIMGQMLFATVNYSHTTCKYNTFIEKANNKFNILTSNRHPVTIPCNNSCNSSPVHYLTRSRKARIGKKLGGLRETRLPEWLTLHWQCKFLTIFLHYQFKRPKFAREVYHNIVPLRGTSHDTLLDQAATVSDALAWSFS